MYHILMYNNNNDDDDDDDDDKPSNRARRYTSTRPFFIFASIFNISCHIAYFVGVLNLLASFR